MAAFGEPPVCPTVSHTEPQGSSWVCLGQESTSATSQGFFDAINIWITRPNVVYKRLFGALVKQEDSVLMETDKPLLEPSSVGSPCAPVPPLSAAISTIERELLPKTSGASSSNEKITIDSVRHQVCFHPFIKETSHSHLGYMFHYQQGSEGNNSSILLYVEHDDDSILLPKEILRPTNDWLKFILLPKLCKWGKNPQQNGRGCETTPLMSTEEYYKTYKRLKDCYASNLIKNWTESTDPYKFVYEDIAIAAYLLVIWEGERREHYGMEKQTFLDLGCGNGLLVYILACEGYVGKGIDLRSRRIWKFLQPKAVLEVATITPSDSTLYPEFDWLIGNHSDELTPWIPVISARSSFSSKFFIIPCCSHDFDRKFLRPNSVQSQYQSYLDYVQLIGEKMGFTVHRDTLNIPSSKRVCLIGLDRNYPASKEHLVDKKRQMFIESRCSVPHQSHTPLTSPKGPAHSPIIPAVTDSIVSSDASNIWGQTMKPDVSTDTLPPSTTPSAYQQLEQDTTDHTSSDPSPMDAWAESFKPRPITEAVRNCTRVEKGVKEVIVAMVTDALLGVVNMVEVSGDHGSRSWNRGGRIHLNDLVSMIDHDLLQRLKREHGGLQTLLRNYCQIFEVKGGYVQLRDWSVVKDSLQSNKYKKHNEWKKDEHSILYKTKLCWFSEHHPQGCPRVSELCSYAHGNGELRNRPDFNK